MKTQQRRWRIPLVLSFLALNLCVDPAVDRIADATTQPAGDVGDVPSGDINHGVSEVRYRLRWSYGKATPLPSGTGWRVTTDLGYDITVTKAYLVSYRVQLVECELELDSLSRSLRLWGSRPAFAGHGDDTNLTTAGGPFLESIDSPDELEVAGLFPHNESFCQFHYLVSGKGAQNDITLHVEGTYRKDGGEVQPFSVDSTQHHGNLLDVSNLSKTLDQPAIIQVTRDLGQMFEHVNFDEDSDKTITWRMLDSLVNTMKVEVL